MDDFPAGPASLERRRPRLSVVIPVFNGERDLERCLRRLREAPGFDYELIVVDDGSSDGSAALAKSFGATVLRHDRTLGPAAARNTGAVAARAAIVFFLDADVAVHNDTLHRAISRFDADPELSALFGSYDDRPDAPGLVSRYRNLLHHYVHQRGRFEDDLRPAHTFWTGCGAIRKDVFLAQGGFDPRLYRRPAIEDIELGYRVTLAGGRIVLARDVQATHLKRWTFFGMIRTDVFQRGVPWMLLLQRAKISETDLNVDTSGRLSVAFTGLAALTMLAGFAWPPGWAATFLCLAVVAVLNRRFYEFLARTEGRMFATACFPLHLIYFCCCGASVVIALAIRDAVTEPDEARPDSQSYRLDAAVPNATAGPRPSPARTKPNRRSRLTRIVGVFRRHR